MAHFLECRVKIRNLVVHLRSRFTLISHAGKLTPLLSRFSICPHFSQNAYISLGYRLLITGPLWPKFSPFPFACDPMAISEFKGDIARRCSTAPIISVSGAPWFPGLVSPTLNDCAGRIPSFEYSYDATIGNSPAITLLPYRCVVAHRRCYPIPPLPGPTWIQSRVH